MIIRNVFRIKLPARMLSRHRRNYQSLECLHLDMRTRDFSGPNADRTDPRSSLFSRFRNRVLYQTTYHIPVLRYTVCSATDGSFKVQG